MSFITFERLQISLLSPESLHNVNATLQKGLKSFFREIEAEKTLARKDSIISPYFQQYSALIAWLISRKSTILVHSSRLVFSLFVKWKKIRNSFDKTTHFKCGSGLFLAPEDFLQFISLEEWLNITKHKKFALYCCFWTKEKLCYFLISWVLYYYNVFH